MCKKKELESQSSSENLDEIDCLIERDVQYTVLLKQYISAQKENEKLQKWFKIIFFAVVILIFILVVSLGSIAIYITSMKSDIALTDVGVALSGLGSILGVIIVLPGKIAENLFPATANKEMIDIVRTMQNYDLNSDAVNNIDVQKYVE